MRSWVQERCADGTLLTGCALDCVRVHFVTAYRKPGAVRFGGSGSRLAETTAPSQSRMAQGSTQEDQGAAGPLDLPEGEALSPAESTEEEEELEVDGSGDELDEQLSGVCSDTRQAAT